MASAADHSEVQAAIDQARAALDALASAGALAADGAQAAVVARELGCLRSRVEAQVVRLVTAAEDHGWSMADGFRSGAAQVGYHANASGAEVSRWTRSGRALRALPEVAGRFAAGRIGVAQVARIGRTWANPRVRGALAEIDEHLATLAELMGFADLDRFLRDWERLADEDGARQRAEHDHHRRNSRMVQGPSGAWTWTTTLGSSDGAEASAVFAAFVAAEWEAEWASARARAGQGASVADLQRTPQQIRADAHMAMVRSAATARAGAPGGSTVETVIVMDLETFERESARLAGLDPGPRSDAGRAAFRCETIDGQAVDPTEATARALLGHVRRAVHGVDGVTIDLGRRTRLFAGPARLAALLGGAHCAWPGCAAPTSRCQVDHLHPWAREGPTDQANAGPFCGSHNRLKEHGFTVIRGPDGTLHVYRPDGSELTRNLAA
ncbi:MAG: DUF222 domain-containing protein [Acidimicrobiales bacterium]